MADSNTSPFLQQSEYVDAYTDAQKYMRYFFEPFDEFERLADNKVRSDLPEGFPSVNDGTLSAMLEEIPIEILGQMVTGNVNLKSWTDPKSGNKLPGPEWASELSNIIWHDKIIPGANTQASFYVKWVVALYRAIKYGGQPIYDFYTVRSGYRGADMSLPYVRDVYYEPGKVSDLDSDFIFMDSYYTKLQIRKIINKATKLKEKGITIPWNIDNLKLVHDSAVEGEKDTRNQNPQERDKGIRYNGIKFTTIFQRGTSAPFDTFHVGLGTDGKKDSGGLLNLRSVKNEDPTGDVPIHTLFAFEDLENPAGRGKVEKSGGTQNVLDYLTQADVLATQIGLQPPIGIKGSRTNTDLNSLLWAPNQFWFEGDAQIDVKKNDTPIYAQFPGRFGLYKSQLLNTLAKTDGAVGGDSGNPGFSKTDAGVKFQQSRAGNAENFLRQMFNDTFNRTAKHMLNEHFSKMQGEDMMTVAQEQATRLMFAGLIDQDPNTNEPSTNEIKVIWDNMRGEYDFDVDPDSSMVKDDADQVEKLIKAVELAAQNPNLVAQMQAVGQDFKIGEAYRQIFAKLGLQDVEKIVAPIDRSQTPLGPDGQPIQGGQPQVGPDGQPVQPSMGAPTAGQPQQPPQGGGAPGAPQQPQLGAAPTGPPEPAQAPQEAPALSIDQLSPEVQQAVQETAQQYGISAQEALAVIHARQLGIPEEAIVEYLQTGQVNGGTPDGGQGQ